MRVDQPGQHQPRRRGSGWTSESASSPLAVARPRRAGASTSDGLGWETTLDVPGEVLMIQVGEHVVLVALGRTAFEAEVGRDRPRR